MKNFLQVDLFGQTVYLDGSSLREIFVENVPYFVVEDNKGVRRITDGNLRGIHRSPKCEVDGFTFTHKSVINTVLNSGICSKGSYRFGGDWLNNQRVA